MSKAPSRSHAICVAQSMFQGAPHEQPAEQLQSEALAKPHKSQVASRSMAVGIGSAAIVAALMFARRR